jgi:hypothetical protein
MIRRRIAPLLALLVLLLAPTVNARSDISGRMLAVANFSILLGRPTDHSVTANVIPDQSGEISFEYGTASGVYGNQTDATPCTANVPVEVVIGGLAPNTRYYYRLRFRAASGDPWTAGGEHAFQTQRAPGSTFTFTIVSDSHLGQYGGQTADQKALYQLTLQSVAAEQPDFHIDLGDTFPMDPSPLGTGMTEAEAKAAYLYQRPYLDAISASAPVYLVIGNHENEEGWNWDDTFTAPDGSLAIRGIKYRKLYYPNPIPDDFYSGNTDVSRTAVDGDHLQEDYFAWEWGDALFVVLDPYHYTMIWPSEGSSYGGEGMDGEAQGDRWDWTLGYQQYEWLKNTLENSDAKWKFVFTHHLTGGVMPYGRGGTGAAPYFEWGGLNWDGTEGFATERLGWEMPIHDLLLANGVNIVFHGHDHFFSKEELDGIVYLEVPKPDDKTNATDYRQDGGGYPTGDNLDACGHIRVTVAADQVSVDYVRAYLPGDGTNGEIAYSFAVQGATPTTNLGGVNNDNVVNSTDALIILSADVGMDTSQFCPLNCGDVNGDGLVNSTDALIILSYDVGMTVPFPVGTGACPSSVTPPPGCTP